MILNFSKQVALNAPIGMLMLHKDGVLVAAIKKVRKGKWDTMGSRRHVKYLAKWYRYIAEKALLN